MQNIAQRLACVLLCVAAPGHAASADFRTDSLATLCTVWSEVKFHNPRLMLREVDWDGALVRAIPKVREAQTNEQLAHAIGAMLAELSDPVTRVARQDGSRPAAPLPAGDRTYLTLPGGIEVTFTGHDVRHADGRPVQGIGLVPDVRVEPTLAGIRAGRDEVLERALAYLRQAPAEAAAKDPSCSRQSPMSHW